MNRKRYNYNKGNNGILLFLKNRLHYKLKIKQTICVVIILLLILMLKLLNNSTSSNVIQIIDNSINYRFSLKEDGNKILEYGKKLTRLPQDALSVFKIKKDSKHQPPVKGNIYNPFGETIYLDGKASFNEGVDIIPSEEKEPISIEKGIVRKVEDKNTKGYFVTIEHETMTTVYGYLISTYVSEGEKVEKGTKIGNLGTNKDGNKYLHFQVWVDDEPVNPTNYVSFNK